MAGQSLRRFMMMYPKHHSLKLLTTQHSQPLMRMSTAGASQMLKVVKDDELPGVSIVELGRKPVNGLNLEFLTEINATIDKIQGASDSKGIIFSSSVPGIFSGGLDIMEMYQPKEERLRLFWRTVQQFFLKLYGCPLVTVAAIAGASPAGGCLIALTCDNRVIAENPKAKIGLNEALLGMMVPPWLKDAYVQTIGYREAERACQMGKLYSPTEALSIGLVDHLVPQEEVMNTSRKEMAKWLKVPEHARQLIKQDLRSGLIQRMVSQLEEDTDNTVAFLTRDSIQKSIGAYLEALKQK